LGVFFSLLVATFFCPFFRGSHSCRDDYTTWATWRISNQKTLNKSLFFFVVYLNSRVQVAWGNSNAMMDVRAELRPIELNWMEQSTPLAQHLRPIQDGRSTWIVEIVDRIVQTKTFFFSPLFSLSSNYLLLVSNWCRLISRLARVCQVWRTSKVFPKILFDSCPWQRNFFFSFPFRI
jgi:hypothetical protein